MKKINGKWLQDSGTAGVSTFTSDYSTPMLISLWYENGEISSVINILVYVQSGGGEEIKFRSDTRYVTWRRRR
jgi:hypothetical protein